MANWHYYNEQGEKITVTGRELKELAKAGLITPGTLVETEDGKKAPAKKVKGLTFAEATSSEQKPEVTTPEPDPFTSAPPKEANPFTGTMPDEPKPITPAPAPPKVTAPVKTSKIADVVKTNTKEASPPQPYDYERIGSARSLSAWSIGLYIVFLLGNVGSLAGEGGGRSLADILASLSLMLCAICFSTFAMVRLAQSLQYAGTRGRTMTMFGFPLNSLPTICR